MSFWAVLIVLACGALVILGIIVTLKGLISSWKGEGCRGCPYRSSCSRSSQEEACAEESCPLPPSKGK